MYDTEHGIDAGTLVLIITFTVIVVSGLFALLTGVSAPSALDTATEEQAINELRAQRI